jgi:polysaccharide deacetylase
LRRLSETETQREIVGSREEIESHLGQAVKSFAYPFGETNRASMECVRKEFHAACTTVLQRANGGSLHSLPRIDMYYMSSQRNLEALLKGQLDQYLRVRRWGRSIRNVLISE